MVCNKNDSKLAKFIKGLQLIGVGTNHQNIYDFISIYQKVERLFVINLA